MKHKISRILCTALCCAPLLASAQTSEKSTSPKRLYQEGQTLFQQKAYAAAISPLQAYVRQMNADGKPLPDTGERQEAEYMLVCAAYELRDPKSIDLLRAFLDEYPDTPHANRIYALIASSYFFEGNYDDALAMFNSARLDLLGTEERDDMTYRLSEDGQCKGSSHLVRDPAQHQQEICSGLCLLHLLYPIYPRTV